jgi:hypothetical protein
MEDILGNKITGQSMVRLVHSGFWHDFECRVERVDEEKDMLWLNPNTARPDGNGFNHFRWSVKRLVVINGGL